MFYNFSAHTCLYRSVHIVSKWFNLDTTTVVPVMFSCLRTQRSLLLLLLLGPEVQIIFYNLIYYEVVKRQTVFAI